VIRSCTYGPGSPGNARVTLYFNVLGVSLSALQTEEIEASQMVLLL
jgi:hypothetical protein